MTADELRTELARITYLPGWHLSIWVDEAEGPVLRIVAADLPDSYGGRIDLGIDTYLSPNDTASSEALIRFVEWRLRRISRHEHREWFKVDGRVVDDPHAAR
jgi:hypothetical protein